MGVIIFNNKSSADCRIQVAHPPGYAYPERDYTITHHRSRRPPDRGPQRPRPCPVRRPPVPEARGVRSPGQKAAEAPRNDEDPGGLSA